MVKYFCDMCTKETKVQIELRVKVGSPLTKKLGICQDCNKKFEEANRDTYLSIIKENNKDKYEEYLEREKLNREFDENHKI